MLDITLLSLSFAQGMLAFFSPCGFPMLPAYLAYYLPRAGDEKVNLPRAALRGVAGGSIAAAGALSILMLIGAGATYLGTPFKARVLLLELVGGVIVLGLGILVLLGKGPSFKVSLQPSKRRGALGLFSFGALYAGVAAGCVAPIFINVLFQAAAAPTFFEGILRVGAYALGLAILLIAITVLVTTAQDSIVRRIKSILPHVERISGIILVFVGLYLIWYWARVELLL